MFCLRAQTQPRRLTGSAISRPAGLPERIPRHSGNGVRASGHEEAKPTTPDEPELGDAIISRRKLRRMIEALFFIPIGPNDINRAVWTVQSIRAYCKQYRVHILLDGPDPLSLPAELSGSDIRVRHNPPSSNGNWGKIWQMQCLAMTEALHDAQVSRNAVFIKMDADALVVRAGLAERAQAIFETRPVAGQIGQCFSSVIGGRLANRGWANSMRKLMGWRGLQRFMITAQSSGEGWQEGAAAFFKYRTLLKHAVDHGYTFGEFAMGGSYILRREVVERLAMGGFVGRSPFRFLPTTGEDGVMTPHVYAVGYAAIDDVSDGGLFAIEGRAFRVDPFVLKSRGHYILHPVKYGHYSDGYSLNETALVLALLK
jgi:hypothetical protein